MHSRRLPAVLAAAAAVPLATLALVVAPPVPPAAAHGGSAAAFTGRAGAFTVYAYDARKGSENGMLEYRVILTDREAGTPVNDATVTLQAEGPEEIGPITADDTANIYYYELPDPGEDEWRVTAEVEGPPGTGEGGEVSFTMHGLEDDEDAVAAGGAEEGEGSSGIAAALGVLAAAGLVGVTLGAVRLKRRPTPGAPG